MDIHGKQDQGNAAEGRDAGEGGSRDPARQPLLDLSDAAVKELIRSAKKRGYVTQSMRSTPLLPSKEANSEQIKEILSIFGEMGVEEAETREAEPEAGVATREEPEEEDDGENELVEVQQRPVPAKSGAKEPAERTDDPVRMYLREMGSVELLSREGEIAIAKRIEAGREAMIAGLCESPERIRQIEAKALRKLKHPSRSKVLRSFLDS